MMNMNDSSILNQSNDFIVVHDFIKNLNYQQSILNASVIDEAMDQIKQQLTSQQLIELINGSHATQQLIAEKAVHQIRKTIKQIASDHLGVGSPHIQLAHSENDQFEHNSDCHINSPLPSHHSNDNDIEMQDNNNCNNHNNNESIVSHDNLSLSLDLELSQKTNQSINTIDTNTNYTILTPSSQDEFVELYISAKQIFMNNIFSQYILDFLDDISICSFAQINMECNENSEKIHKYIFINTNDWLFKYVLNGTHCIKHMIHCAEIILDFSRFDERTDDFLLFTLNKMKAEQIFAQCEKLCIISISTRISRILSPNIGALNCINELFFKDIEIFPMINIVKQIASTMRLKRISMVNININRDSSCKYYTDADEWMNININTNITHRFMERLMECDYIAVSGWTNKHSFWNKWLDYLYNTFECSNREKLSMTLQDSISSCPIRELIYLPGDPCQDRIPHIWFKFMLKYKAFQIKKLTLHFASNTNLYHAIINKSMIHNLEIEMNVLNELYFGWNDRDSYKILNCFIKGNKLKKVKLWLPQSRNLCKQEEKIIAAIKRKSNHLSLQKGIMRLCI